MLDRRQLLAYAIGLVAASSTGAMTAYAASGSAGAPDHYFSVPRRALLDAVADVMIPRTDTPGALEFAEFLQLGAHDLLRQPAEFAEDLQLQFLRHPRQLRRTGWIKNDLK